MANLRETLRSWRNNLQKHYRLVIMVEESLHQVGSYRITTLNVYLALSALLVGTAIFVFLLMTQTPLLQYLPGSVYQVADQADWIRLNQHVKSLEKELEDQQVYTENLRKIFTGTPRTVEDVEEDTKNIKLDSQFTVNRISQDEELRKALARDLNNNTNANPQGGAFIESGNTSKSVESLKFLPPLKGVISAGFSNQKEHFGIDIAAPKNTPIVSVLDGHVVLADWTMDTGNTLCIQHGNNVLTFYKHCASLLKKKGDYVKGGEAIAIIGNTGTQSTGPHLHFEIWVNGKALDPSKYVHFN